jgi:2,5-furandicarboxylate decarboxylase 1
MSQDLRTFLNLLRNKHPDELWEIDTPVSKSHEMTALALELERRKRFPALLFTSVTGSSIPVLCNLFANRKRIALALGLPENELVSGWPELAARRISPVRAESGPVKEGILKGEQVDLSCLPIPVHFEADAGPYITAGIITARDPDTGIGNLSYARLQVKGSNRLGASLHSRGNLWDFQRRSEAQGKPLEIAAVLGTHPAVAIAAATRLPLGEDELELAGGLLGEPVELVRAETVDLMVPTNAEMIIEGYIEPNVREDEGPFGEYTGYASARSTRHVVHVTAITHRKDMIFHDIIPGASSEHLGLSKTSRVPQYFRAVKNILPNVVEMNYPNSGTHFHCYLSMCKTQDGQPRQAMALLFGLDMYLKLVVVVDEDIDVFNEQQVLWALATRFQADRDQFVLPQAPCNLLDPSSSGGLGAKLGLDATRKFGGEVKILSFSPELNARVESILNSVNHRFDKRANFGKVKFPNRTNQRGPDQ